MFARHRRHGQARLFCQLHLAKNFIGFDLRKYDGFGQNFFRRNINRRPIAFFGGRIGIKLFGNARKTDDGFFFAAVVKENAVAGFHGAEIKPRRHEEIKNRYLRIFFCR